MTFKSVDFGACVLKTIESAPLANHANPTGAVEASAGGGGSNPQPPRPFVPARLTPGCCTDVLTSIGRLRVKRDAQHVLR